MLRMRNAGATEAQIADMAIEPHMVDNIAAVVALARTGTPADHFILMTHTSSREVIANERNIDYIRPITRGGGQIGGSQGLLLGGYHAWDEQDVREMFNAFRDHCLDLTLFLCRVSEKRAQWIQRESGARTVFYSQAIKDYDKFLSFGVYFPPAPAPARSSRGRPQTERPPPPPIFDPSKAEESIKVVRSR